MVVIVSWLKRVFRIAGWLLLLWVCWGVAVYAWFLVKEARWRANPGPAFKEITGRDLPAGVRATAYSNELTDNFFHTSHYWMLRGAPVDLAQVISGADFLESSDAPYMLPDLKTHFNDSRTSADVVSGYEWESGGRDRWYISFPRNKSTGQQDALYIH